MKRQISIFLVLFLFFLFSTTIGWAKSDKKKEISSNTVSRAADDGVSLSDKSNPPVANVQLDNVLELENAIQEYLLFFEAYLSAHRSTVSAIRAKSGDFLQFYRRSYAHALKLLLKHKVIHPLMPKDPAGWYGQKYSNDKGVSMQWRFPDFSRMKVEVQTMVDGGRDPHAVQGFIMANLPTDRPNPAAGVTDSAPEVPYDAEEADGKLQEADGILNAKLTIGENIAGACEDYLKIVRKYRATVYSKKESRDDQKEEADEKLANAIQNLWNARNLYSPDQREYPPPPAAQYPGHL